MTDPDTSTRGRFEPPRTSRGATLRSLTAAVALLLAGALVAGCGGPEEEPAPGGEAPEAEAGGTGELSAAARAALDSGNVAYKEGDFETALEKYRHAAEASPRNPSPVFGIRMAAQAMGDTALADSALSRLRELTPEPGPMHPAPADTSGDGGG